MNTAELKQQVTEATRNTDNALNALRKAREEIARLMSQDRANQSTYSRVYSALSRAIKEASAAEDALSVIR